MKKLLIYFTLFSTLTLHGAFIDIKADHFYANDINHEAFFEGNAIINQGSNMITAQKIKVSFNHKRKATKYEASGGVSFDLMENGIQYQGQAYSIEYAPKSSEYLFIGDVVLQDLTNNRTIKAEMITLDLKTGLADVKGSEKKPVHFRFEIEDRE